LKRIIFFVFLSFIIIFQAGCSSVSIEDAKRIADQEKAKSVRNLNKYREELAIEHNDKNDKNNDLSRPDFSIDKNDNKKINVIDMAETANKAGFEVTVLNSINAKNINEVN